jgi:hypothetical protein
MRGILKYFIFTFLVVAAGCERTGRFSEFLRPVPVEPLTELIRTALPVGNCAMIAMADQMGFQVPGEKIPAGGDFSIIRIIPTDEYPLLYLDESCTEIMILSFPADDDFAVLSIFFILHDPDNPQKRILEVHTIPAMVEDGNIKAVFASQDIYVRDSVELNLQMGPANIRIELDRLETPRPETSEAAVRQNAWIIEVDPAGTWDDFTDDRYTLTGGEQDVSVLTGRETSETGVIQLAMIGTLMGRIASWPRWKDSPYCGRSVLIPGRKNPWKIWSLAQFYTVSMHPAQGKWIFSWQQVISSAQPGIKLTSNC